MFDTGWWKIVSGEAGTKRMPQIISMHIHTYIYIYLSS